MSAGYVYILSNESMPGIYKIGFTRRCAQERADELYKNNTSVPKPFEVVAAIWHPNAAGFEKGMHEHYAKYRVNENREFFELEPWDDVDDVIAVLVENAVRSWASDVTVVPTKHYNELKQAKEQLDEISAKKDDSRALELVKSGLEYGPPKPVETGGGVLEQLHEQAEPLGVAVNCKDG